MSDATTAAAVETLADLVDRLGRIPLDRIRFRPSPGTATEQHVIEIEERENRLCELVDGVLVEKPMGYTESVLAVAIGALLREFVVSHNLGHVSGADGMMRLFPGLVRIPDVAFVSWNSFPDRRLPDDPIPDLVPDLAVEVLSRSNTAEEMRRKRREYFQAGVHLVWMVDPQRRRVSAFTSPEESMEFSDQHVLSGGTVLPGFSLSLSALFGELDRTDSAPPPPHESS